jgi:hypothetical protein
MSQENAIADHCADNSRQPTRIKENADMARPILFLTALLLVVPAIAADNKGLGSVKQALEADCERQANQQNLIGKQRKKFVKDCTKQAKQAQRRDRIVPGQQAQPAAQPPVPGPAQGPGTPTAPATSPPIGTAPAQTAAIPQPPKPGVTADQKRANCTAEAQRANVVISARKLYIEKCMAR